MTPTKIALAGAAALALSAAFVFQRTPAPLVLPTEAVIKERNIQTIAMEQMPFDHPSWEPDEATKKKALIRAYHMNGGSMVGDHMIDVSQQEGIVADPAVVNELDEQADNPNWEARRRFMNRTFRATHDQLAHHDKTKKDDDVCKRHGLHKVIYGDKWRCRK